MDKIIVINQYNSDNLGDKLLNSMICERIKSYGYNVENVGFAQVRKQEINRKYNDHKKNKLVLYIKKILPNRLKYMINYRLKLKREANKIDFEKCKAIIIGGGQLIKHKSVFKYCFSYWVNIALANKVPVILYGIGVDNNLNKREIHCYGKNMKKIKYVNCRDEATASLLNNYFDIKADVSPDIAFTYFKDSENEEERKNIVVMPYNYITAKKAFKIKLSRKEYYDRILNYIINVTKQYNNYNIILTATTNVDLEECIDFKEYLTMNGKKSEILEIETYEELAELFLRSNIVISGRMHAMILGLVCGCSVIDIPISNKITEFSGKYINGDVDIQKTKRESNNGITKLVEYLERGNNEKEF